MSFFPLHLLSLLLCILQSILSPYCGITAALICNYNPACFTGGASLQNHQIIQGRNRYQRERSGRTEFPHGRVRNLLFWKASAWVLPRTVPLLLLSSNFSCKRRTGIPDWGNAGRNSWKTLTTRFSSPLLPTFVPFASSGEGRCLSLESPSQPTSFTEMGKYTTEAHPLRSHPWPYLQPFLGPDPFLLSTEAVGLMVTPAPSEWWPLPWRGLVAGAGQMPQPPWQSLCCCSGQKKTFLQLHNPVTHRGLAVAGHSRVLRLGNNGLSEVIYFHSFSVSSEKIQFKLLQVSKASPWQSTSETHLDKFSYLSRRLDGDLLLRIHWRQEYHTYAPKAVPQGAGNATHGRWCCCSTRTQTPLRAAPPRSTSLEELQLLQGSGEVSRIGFNWQTAS